MKAVTEGVIQASRPQLPIIGTKTEEAPRLVPVPQGFQDNPHGEAKVSTRPDSQIFEVLPREQAGARTGAKYEFQYHQAAFDGLQLLDDSKAVCLYCEWHDDYAIETPVDANYRFHQVKTRAKADGQWKINAFFGIRSRPKKAKDPGGSKSDDKTGDGSIFLKMYDHINKFGKRCEAFVFVTDAGIDRDFQALRDAAVVAGSFEKLDSSSLKQMAKIQEHFAKSKPEITINVLFDFILRLEFKDAIGTEKDMDLASLELARKVLELSEVDLRVSESRKIVADLVSMVRKKSHSVLAMVPMNIEELRHTKGIMIHDVLNLLSLSSAGYRELRTGGRDSVVTLSRLQRYCREHGFGEDIVKKCCECKALWDEWYLRQQYFLDPLDLVPLTKECRNLLVLHQSEGFGLDRLVDEIKAITNKYETKITASEKLTSSHVMGLVLTLVTGASS